MKRRFWKSDWFAGLAVTLIFVVASGTAALQALERVVYDVGVRGAEAAPSDRVAVIAIDDESIDNLGRWPWSRELHARLIERLAAGGADAIGYTVLFPEPQVDPGLAHIRDALEDYRAHGIGRLPGLIDDPEVTARAPASRHCARASPTRPRRWTPTASWRRRSTRRAT